MKSKHNDKRSKSTQKDKANNTNYLTQPNRKLNSNKGDDNKYCLKMLFIKNLNNKGEQYPLTRAITTIQLGDAELYSNTLYSHSMTPKTKRISSNGSLKHNKKPNNSDNSNSNSNQNDELLKARLRKPFEYSFKDYLAKKLNI